MRIFGICRVRDETDLIGVTIAYHLGVGIDRVLVLDNGSSDGTREVLEHLERTAEVGVIRDRGPFRSGTMTTRLARWAHAQGADWVLPFDADEFWFAPRGDLREVLAESGAGALRVGLVNFVQRRDQARSQAEALLTMTRRVSSPVGTPDFHEQLVEEGRIAFVEGAYPPKWACRPTAEVVYDTGSHGVLGALGPVVDTEGLVILHAPLRSRASLEAKAVSGQRVIGAGFEGHNSWHLRRWHRLAAEGKLEAEWRANSWEDEVLDVYGSPHPLVVDRLLADTLAPFIAR
jgi:glycosyltransferase involved in cell wall biosynthesis